MRVEQLYTNELSLEKRQIRRLLDKLYSLRNHVSRVETFVLQRPQLASYAGPLHFQSLQMKQFIDAVNAERVRLGGL